MNKNQNQFIMIFININKDLLILYYFPKLSKGDIYGYF